MDYANQQHQNKYHAKGEASFVNHKQEFMRFFRNHQKLCDELSGIKRHEVSNNNEELTIRITRENYGLAIKKLNSFIIDYLHYITNRFQKDEIIQKYEQLENEFINDHQYKQLILDKENRTTEEEMIFTQKYMNYLFKTFEAAQTLSKALQNSLNIGTSDIAKEVYYMDYEGFYNNLAVYREEVSRDLSNLSYSTLFLNYKKLLGYFFTYRHLLKIKTQKRVLDILGAVYNYMIKDEIMNVIISLKKREIDSEDRFELGKDMVIFRKAFNKVYSLCNEGLSERNVLPKTKREVIIDRTLI